jgi:hypothetical protein
MYGRKRQELNETTKDLKNTFQSRVHRNTISLTFATKDKQSSTLVC